MVTTSRSTKNLRWPIPIGVHYCLRALSSRDAARAPNTTVFELTQSQQSHDRPEQTCRDSDREDILLPGATAATVATVE